MTLSRNNRVKTVIVMIILALAALSSGVKAAEIREYEGKSLDPFDRKYDNSIKGPQYVNKNTYRLEVTGLVQKPLKLTYDEVLALPHVKKVFTVHCVEGWDETLLYEGVYLRDILKGAGPKSGVKTVIFYAADGYSSSIPYDYAKKVDSMIGAKINGLVLDAKRGFPFQVVNDGKLGYKWVKWLTKIELSDKDYRGFWERRGYSNDADVK
ncbi:MAG: molybdopterin-dependent oxidoreductase [Deltaproteobacteria bacterium]|nr:molybdopterin-dependent oxidoreductase [Candidatus Zymogenaceae bacterium]